jgi:hypothetical protein
MTAVLERLLDLLPPPWTQAPDSVLASLLGVGAMEFDTAQEDLDRLRRSHWIGTAFRLGDVEKLAALVGVTRLPWEQDVDGFRERVRAIVTARLQGALGAAELRRFVYDYLAGAQRSLHAVLVPGLPAVDTWEDAFAPPPEGQPHRKLGFVEFPAGHHRSAALALAGGKVPYLFRWTERNGGLDPAPARVSVTGLGGFRTAVPVIANLTTGDLVGWAGVVGTGRRLAIGPGPDGRSATAVLDDEVSGRVDVSSRLFSVSGYEPGQPFGPGDLDPVPQAVLLERGDNDLRYLSVGLYDVRGLDHVFFALAADALREGIFDDTRFDEALFPGGTVAGLDMDWDERAPATFRVRVPRGVIVEDPGIAGTGTFADVHSTLRASLDELRAAGVRAELELVGLRETQDQRVRAQLPWVSLPREVGPSGEGEELARSGQFGESALDESRFE